MSHYERESIKHPKLKSLDDKVSVSRAEGRVPEGGTGLGAAVTKVRVQPETKLPFPRSYGETVHGAPGMFLR